MLTPENTDLNVQLQSISKSHTNLLCILINAWKYNSRNYTRAFLKAGRFLILVLRSCICLSLGFR